VADARFAKPLDTTLIRQLAERHDLLITVEEGASGGFGACVLQHLAETGQLDGSFAIRSVCLPDRFEQHAAPQTMYERSGLTAPHLASTALDSLVRKHQKQPSKKIRLAVSS
jgi:1-deoxy-D-xylulose-5-phosphate synthase